MTVSEALYNRRSMRAFKQDPIPGRFSLKS